MRLMSHCDAIYYKIKKSSFSSNFQQIKEERVFRTRSEVGGGGDSGSTAGQSDADVTPKVTSRGLIGLPSTPQLDPGL